MEIRLWTSLAYGRQIRKSTCRSRTGHRDIELHIFFSNGLDAKGLGQTQLNFTRNLIGGVYQSGALFSFKDTSPEILLRVGVSFKSTDQACSNAETEVGSSSFDEIVAQSKALWNEKLGKIEIDVAHTPANVTEMLYSSLYRSFLTPVSNLSLICVCDVSD